MSIHSGTGLGSLPLASLMHIDAVCDRFEQAWRAGESPDMLSYLADTAGPPRSRLFDGLLTIELEFRLARGETPDFRAYRDRFPEFHQVIAAAFARFDLAGMTLPSSGNLDPAAGEPGNPGLGTGLP